MLKIKDDVDLKELEKFGLRPYFNYNKVIKYYYCYDFKVCKNRHLKPFNGTNHKRYDIVYDLIKADMVEKVDD